MSFSNILSNRIAAGYGDYAVGGNGVQMRIPSLIFVLVLALANGFQSFAGYNYSAKHFDRLRKGFKLNILYGTILCCMGFLLLRLFGDVLIRFFINDAKTIEAGTTMLHVFIWGLPFIGVQLTFLETYQALGKPVETTIITIGRQFIFYIPLLYLLNSLFGFAGFIWAQPIADILTTAIALVLSRPLFHAMRGVAIRKTE
jgi:Na+-driven multidrug efflux pump